MTGPEQFQLPDSADVVLRSRLEWHASRAADEEFVTFEDGSSWTRQAGLREASRAANALRAHGVRQGDRVAVFLPNSADFLRAWWGTAMLGAILLPVNISYRGALLSHLLSLGKPSVIVGSPELLARLDELSDAPPVLRLLPSDLESDDSSVPQLERPLGLWDPATLPLTSGTTGPSKLVLQSYLNNYCGGFYLRERTRGAEDVFLIDLPLFHAAAIYYANACVGTGTRMAIRTRPELSSYWEVARDTGATMAIVLGSMGSYLESLPERPAEKEHGLRYLLSAPLPADPDAFKRRFNIPHLFVSYGGTEAPGVLALTSDDHPQPGYCGRPIRGFELRIVDEHDIELPAGQPGELIVRGQHPWMIATEYFGNLEATAAVWRNGWFHTGDMLRRDEDGRYFFIDRIKDSIRRRGENISSTEVEAEIVKSDAVEEVACVPYKAPESSDDEVKAWIVPSPEAELDFGELLRFCVDRLPHFMVPRYFEVIDTLPRTPSGKTMKYQLAAMGNTEKTWDRESHGYSVTRNGLEVKHSAASRPIRGDA